MRALRTLGFAVTLLIAAAATLLSAQAGPSGPGFQVICNPNNPVSAVDRQFLQDVFLKKVRVWPTGDATDPVDQAPGSPVRRQFTEQVLRRPVETVRIFWQQRIFAGRDLPPPEVGSDAEAVRFVLRERGAIGYVSRSADLRGAKILTTK